MPEERVIQAMNRVERALARIEAAAERGRSAEAGIASLEQLREAHEALRARVAGAIDDIDAILADREGQN